MKLVVLNAGDRLKHLLDAENLDVRIAATADLSSFVRGRTEGFAVLWHGSLRDAKPILVGMAPNWPIRLTGCALFSSVPYANGTKQEADRFFNENPLLRDRVHVCSDSVRKEGPAAEVKDRLAAFHKRVSVLESTAPPPLPFYLLEPGAPDSDILTAQIACLVSANSRHNKIIESCLDWDLLGPVLSLSRYDLSSLKRSLRRQPNQIKCPLCAYRGPLKHTLETTSNALPVLSGDKGLKTLRQLTKLDAQRELKQVLETHIRTCDSCKTREFIDLGAATLASMFERRCALYSRRTKLLDLCDKVEASISGGDGTSLADLVPAIIDVLSCDQDDDPLIEQNYKIRLAQAL